MTHFSKPILYPDLINHVILKSLDGQLLFREEADRADFLYYLRQSIEKYDLQVYAYGLMEGHIHLLFRMPLDPSPFIYHLKKSYSLCYRRKYRTRKPLFQPLFKAETASDPVSLVCFICRDPVRQGLVSAPFDSSWTSIGLFRGEDLPADRKALLALAEEKDWLLLLSSPQSRSFMEYTSFPTQKETRLIIRSVCSPEEKARFHYLSQERKSQILGELRSCGVTYSAIRDNLGISKYEIDLALGKIRNVQKNMENSPIAENDRFEDGKNGKLT